MASATEAMTWHERAAAFGERVDEVDARIFTPDGRALDGHERRAVDREVLN